MSIKAVWGTTMDQKVHKGKQDLLKDMGKKKKSLTRRVLYSKHIMEFVNLTEQLRCHTQVQSGTAEFNCSVSGCNCLMTQMLKPALLELWGLGSHSS